jgi:ribosomal protein S18 acetylase RimI-like enzyme
LKNNYYFGKITRANPLKKNDYYDLAKLLISIFPQYYDCFRCKNKNIINAVIYLLKKRSNTEFKKIYIVRRDRKIVAVATLVNFRDLKSVKMYGFRDNLRFIKLSEIDLKKLKILKNSFQNIKDRGVYITRFGVHKQFWGKHNISKNLINFILNHEKNNLIAHVYKKNIRALNFYKKNNFLFFKSNKDFLQIIKKY